MARALQGDVHLLGAARLMHPWRVVIYSERDLTIGHNLAVHGV